MKQAKLINEEEEMKKLKEQVYKELSRFGKVVEDTYKGKDRLRVKFRTEEHGREWIVELGATFFSSERVNYNIFILTKYKGIWLKDWDVMLRTTEKTLEDFVKRSIENFNEMIEDKYLEALRRTVKNKFGVEASPLTFQDRMGVLITVNTGAMTLKEEKQVERMFLEAVLKNKKLRNKILRLKRELEKILILSKI